MDAMGKTLALVACLIFLTSCFDGKAADNVVVSFEGGGLTIEDLLAHHDILQRTDRNRGDSQRLTPEYVLDHAVNMELIIAKGLKEKLHLDPHIRARIHRCMSELFLKVLTEKLVPEIDREDFTEEEVRAYYEEHRESYRSEPAYGIRIIKSNDKDLLGDLRSKIERDEVSFASAAQEYSEDDGSREKGGYIGKRRLDQYKPNWRTSVQDLRLNKITGPRRIGDAYYLLQLVEKTEPRQFTYEEKKAYVRNDLLYSRYREEWRNAYDRLREEFSLEVDEDNVARFYREMNPS
jgi:hypothetical protein